MPDELFPRLTDDDAALDGFAAHLREALDRVTPEQVDDVARYLRALRREGLIDPSDSLASLRHAVVYVTARMKQVITAMPELNAHVERFNELLAAVAKNGDAALAKRDDPDSPLGPGFQRKAPLN